MEQTRHRKDAKTPPNLSRNNFFSTFSQNYLVDWLRLYNFAPVKIQVQAVNDVNGRANCITPPIRNNRNKRWANL